MKTTVLVVDDEADVRSSLRRILKLDGYEVSEAGSVGEMLALDNLEAYHCIILDRKLPDGSADEVLPALKERTPDADILIVTGYTDLQGTLSALRHGAEDYLIKPVDPDDLRTSIRRLTQLRRMRSALQESEARYRGMLETVPVGVLTMDADGRVESANPAVEAITGYRPEDLIGDAASRLIAPTHQEHWQDLLAQDNSGEARIGRELMARRKSGDIYPVAVTVGKAMLPNGTLNTVILEDITGRKQLERDVLRASEDEKHRIAQDLHDGLASHLTGVSLLCQMLTEGDEGPHTAMARQISDLIEEGIHQARTVARGLYPVEDHAEGLMDALGKFAERIRADLKLDCRFDCPEPVLVADNGVATHLYRIAQEATNNAIRHANASQIAISLKQDGDQIVLRIRDNGTGIRDQRPSQGQSKGIGLRTMAYRAGLLRGTLEIAPAAPEGTVVRCAAPLPGEGR